MQNVVRTFLKKIPAVEAAAGLYRYAQYRAQLNKANRQDVPSSSLPPAHLRYRVHRSFDVASYEEAGRRIAGDISDALDRAGAGMDGARVLDLGSGPGRVAKWFKQRHPGCSLVCADIDPEAIDWAHRSGLDFATFVLSPAATPTSFEAASFDFVYCISLFTHLDEPMQDAWLRELERIVKPGGLVLATTHGALAMASCTVAERRVIQDSGFLFRISKRRFKLDGLPDFYQTTFHSREYVERKWSRVFELAAYREGGIGGHQDLVLMRRRGDPRHLEGCLPGGHDAMTSR